MGVELLAKLVGFSGDVPQGIILAYMGPGPGLAAIGALLAVGGVGLTMLIGLIWYPVKQVLRRWRAWRVKQPPPANPSSPAGQS